ncbi:MAG TPA: shikimate dehydrogenase [Stenomitos sp.]
MITITGNTKLLGVMGCPIKHSLSPLMHNAALQERAVRLGHSFLEYVYLPLNIDPSSLEVALSGLWVTDWQGFNVTIPHKQAIIPYLQTISPLAQAVGAVNTVVRQAEGWMGTNTDVQGFLAPLLPLNRPWHSIEACILGNGGAARAVIAACAQLGCAAIHAVGRDLDKLRSLQSDVAAVGITLQTHQWDALPSLLPRSELVVNTTPIGMHPHRDATPLEQSDLVQLPTQAVVYDLIYTPRPTRLLELSAQRGLVAIDGLDMLVFQGAAAYEQWIGEPPSIPVMQQALEAYLTRP